MKARQIRSFLALKVILFSMSGIFWFDKKLTIAILAESCGYEFQKEQMEQISRVLVRIDIPKDRVSGSMFGRQFYLREKYAALNVESAKKIQNGEMPIKNRFRYFLRMLEDDAFQPTAY